MAEEKKTMSDRKKGLKDEFSKIIWPSSEMVGKQSTVVIIISVVLAIIIAVVDMVVQYGVDLLVNL